MDSILERNSNKIHCNNSGKDVLLPCHLSPERSAADAKEIRWFKESFNNLVYLHKSGKVTEGRGYEGRVSLFPQELQRGNVSLLLRNVRLTDGGKYKCQVSFSDWFEEPALQLTVRREYKLQLL
uniref:Ig-like domain-containing protein n=1 Tax=Scleropages formosus TaxID=113540 RepID=A0A8C9VWV2_SCLFO